MSLDEPAVHVRMMSRLREIFTADLGAPEHAYTNGEVLNTFSGTQDYDPHRGYHISAEGIEPMDETE